ncbi:trans-sulfuration enzyme family protein [Clostridium neonatale]|uniref:Cystathionine beta-lyase n=1 Tax=Clostridium neonatale TaxID=137838 RepID=A0A650LRT4_9CLOT|nr:PLP-dependent aspartate aminotransferase family protein [Clostridium neonatale]MBP8311727.1 PLP-dependent transferase [Clostridium neonatale]CAG9710546.1 Putative cystathionine homocysteine gamma-lyase MccB [Clostridium neonatale]CAI3588958.1 putative cystathionine homocysteine gamma-lyase MccB [Clostridium neonatale]CAI3654256.1 putative cystathionine homocysteine gamma-lyase MccB [Clostridium neonatale]CAI3663676.1 putative cystathionine homocysteine gamma-lyase MccB [Clostridium neonatal
MKIESLLVHGGIDGDEFTGAVNVPIYQTSTYKQAGLGDYKYEYSRTGNPTREALEKTIATLENGVGGLAFGSGMAAITAVLSLFKSGDKIIIPNNLYGGTFRVVDKVFKNFNINYEIVDISRLSEVREVLEDNKNNTPIKAILIETPTNPLMDITDIEEVSILAKEFGALTVVDNTFMSPYLQRPLDFGADVVVHSATKYLGGHSNVVAGLIVVNDQELLEKLHFIQNSTGGVLGPFDSFILLQGIKTLGVRLDRHNENASKIAEFLLNSNYVSKIYYPGLKDSKGYEIQKKQASGSGGMISFVVADNVDYKKFVKSLKLITLAESLGGVESLICHPATMTHAAIPYEIRQKVGIVDNLLRLSVGIENVDDLIDDLNNAFKESLM